MKSKMRLIRSALRKALSPLLERSQSYALTKKSYGEISLQEARFLGELIRCLKAGGPIIEIGTHFGFSTQVICLYKGIDRQLITVDNYSWNSLGLSPDNHFLVTKKQFCMDKNEFYTSYTADSPSLVFLDAIHTYEETKKDISWAKSVGAEVICGHDYSEECPGVVKAVQELGGYGRLVNTLWLLKANN
jgi:hypothetical protein